MSATDLPPYTYTPGVTPHPVSDPQGHSYGHAAASVTVHTQRLSATPAFRRGVQLFREGYYWEAHEEWESVWHALGRHGATADLLKGLIKLAAAGVKAREGNAEGVHRHALRAVELLSLAENSGFQDDVVDRGSLNTLVRQATKLSLVTTSYPRLDHGRPVVFWAELAGEIDRL
jgi:uncharacterized protein